MRKIIRKYGNATVIKLDAEDKKVYDLKEGDQVDIEICKVKKKNGK
jgi:antitoxin component of MazEF toxin-antitoxin module